MERRKSLLKWAIALAVLAFLFFRYREQMQQLEWSRLRWDAGLAAVALCAIAQILTYIRWYLLVAAQGFAFTIHDAIRLGFIGYLFNYVAPGAVGGDLVKGSLIAREQKSRRAIAVATVLLDRIVGLMGLILLAAGVMQIASPLVENETFRKLTAPFAWAALALTAGLIFVLLPGVSQAKFWDRFERVPKVGGLLKELVVTMRLYQSRWRLVVMSVAMSVVSHAILIASVYFSALALGVNVPNFVAHLQLVPPAELVGVLVPLPGGTGALEGALSEFYGMTVVDGTAAAIKTAKGNGFLAGLVYRLVTILVAIAGAGWYLADRKKIDAAMEENQSVDEMLADSEKQPVAEN